MDKDPFKEYIKQSEPNKREKGYAWHMASGLQAVDGLKPSKYLIDTAIKNIEGDISIDEVQELLNSYYEENPKKDLKDRADIDSAKADIDSAKADIESAEADIESAKADIESEKADIRNKLLTFSDTISEKTVKQSVKLFLRCEKEEYFGRTIVEEIAGLKSTRASELIKILVDSKVIVPVTGHGKGKYRFIV